MNCVTCGLEATMVLKCTRELISPSFKKGLPYCDFDRFNNIKPIQGRSYVDRPDGEWKIVELL